MSNGHDLYLDLCAALALGSLAADDRRVLDEHLDKGCAVCTAFLRDTSAPLEALALSSAPARPSKGLKARVMVAIAQRAGAAEASEPSTEVPSARPPRARLLPGWAWAAAALLLAAAGVGWWRTSVMSERVAELAERPATPDPDEQWEAWLRAHPQARVIDLAAQTGADPERKARVAYDAASRRALAHFANFTPPRGEAFELWTVRGGKPYSEGLVTVDARGRGVRQIENVGDPAQLAAFAVSSEVEGGASDRQTPRAVQYAGGAS